MSENFEPAAGQAPIRGHIRAAGHLRVSHGLFLPEVDGADAETEWRRMLHAWQQVLPASAVFTHVTAARLYGWDLPQLPEQVPVFAAVNLRDRRPRRDGLVCSRLTRPQSERTEGGFPVDSPEEVLLRAARDLGVLDLVILVDSALRLGHLDASRMEEILASGRAGVGVLRAAHALASAVRESAGESVLGTFFASMEVPVEPQVDLYDGDGLFLGRADFLVIGSTWVYEYDGAVHRDKEVHRRDLRRERNWSHSAYVRKGFTLDDLLNHPLVVMHEIDRDLDRPHRPSRIRRWRVLVRESLYSESGRARVLNRWRRAMGVVQWS